MALKKKQRNAQFVAAARRLRRRPVGFTSAINRAAANAGSSRNVESAAERIRNRPPGFTSALNRVRANEANRRRLR